MKIIFLCFCLCFLVFAEDFITAKEYAKMLYENPRGISCKKCHGEDGSEQVLEYFMQKGERKAFVIKSIQNLSFEEFKTALEEPKDTKSIMPSYSLTSEEINALYAYIDDLNKEKNNGKNK